MDTKNKIIIVGDTSEMIDKDLFNEFLQFMKDVKSWEIEMYEDIKQCVKVYETPGNTPISTE